MDISELDRGVRVKSKKPSDSNFKQQRLPSWQPILTAGTVLPTFFVIGFLFIPIGILLLHFSNTISETVIDYTFCNETLNGQSSGTSCAKVLAQNPKGKPCQCSISFRLPTNYEGKVYLYYGLSNFYQNHRRYVKSRDDNQLLGEFANPPSTDCTPFHENNGHPIVPCGAIANSLFNDTLTIRSESNGIVPVYRTGIAWPSDKEIKFRNPPGDLRKALEGTSRPIAWQKELWELDVNDTDNNGLQNEDLIVWMRTAALPSFRKLYRRVNHSNNLFKDGLPAGMYWLDIEYNYPVTQFDGTKSFIISTTSILGGKNPFLGYAYIVVGSVCILLGVLLLVIHLRYRGSSQSSTNNTNPRTPYT